MDRIQVNPGTPITQGNNPWVDAITYNAQWRQRSWNEPVRLRVNFLQPRQFSEISNRPIVERNLSDPTYAGWDPKKPIARFLRPVQQAYLQAYQAWNDVALIGAKPVRKPREADVTFILANYNNDGYKSGNSGPQLQGSHEGLLRIGKYGFVEPRPAIQPLISDANASVARSALQPGGEGIEPGSNFFLTAIHEIGHGIGLSHPHDDGLGSVPSGVFPGLTPNDPFARYGTGLYGLNQTPFTIMTYVDGFQDGSVYESRAQAMTPMALDVMAAQLKYGTNKSTRSGDNIYNLYDIMRLNTWQCIWDTGGEDTITGEELLEPLVINLRAAEMNAVRPETGSPYERYDWGIANQWQEELDTFLGLTASRMGFMLGSGVLEAYKLRFGLNKIYSQDQQLWLEIQDQILEPLSAKLSQLRNLSFDYSDWARAITTLAGGHLPYLAKALAKEAGVATSKKDRRTLKIAADAAEDFTQLDRFSVGLVNYIANLDDTQYQNYLDGLAEVRAIQNEIMSRSAPGIAGNVSTFRPELYRDYENSGGFTIAAGVTIENAEGGSGDDEIIGNAVDNKLYGNSGDDLIDGYLGNNLIDGGIGTDTAILFGSLSDYTFSGDASNLIASNIPGGYESSLISIEAVKIGDATYSPLDLLTGNT